MFPIFDDFALEAVAEAPAAARPTETPPPGVQRFEEEEQHQQAQQDRRQPEQLPEEESQHLQHHDRRKKKEENKRLDIFERLIANFPDFLAQAFAASANSVVTNRAHTTPAYPHQQRPTEDLVQSREKKRLVDAHLRSSAFLAGDPLTGAPLFENFAFLQEDPTGVVGVVEGLLKAQLALAPQKMLSSVERHL
ncbi:unnamed protein product [Amoebophrya sp. A25]|nr:unnamed protein product [Amoebophrya sp. A25]|eukprot:GSA25T00003797001.1